MRRCGLFELDLTGLLEKRGADTPEFQLGTGFDLLAVGEFES